MIRRTADPRAWTAATADAPETWYYRLPADCLRHLDEQGRDPRPVTDLRLPPAARAACRDALADVARALEAGRGFAIIEGIPPGRHAPPPMQAVYWLVGQALGEPIAQNVQGTLLYDVRDTGQDLAAGARFSVTSYESSFHTDNSFGEGVADYVGLLCLQVARSGGINHLVSGRSVLGVLRAESPEALAVLSQPFHVERRGGTRPGEAPTILRPVIEDGPDGPVFRYLRYWIEAGHQRAGVPLTAAQRQALDALDGVLRRPELRVEFALRPGQMLFLNNRWLLHNRTAFEDHPEPQHRRHLVRLWLEAARR